MAGASVEFVDIVDAHNNVLYRTTKACAHARGLLHRIVIGEIRDERGSVVLVKAARDREDGGRLVSAVGGHVRSRESELDALRRETLEEIGLEIQEFKHVGRLIYDRIVDGQHERHLYSVFEASANPHEIVLGDEATAVEVLPRDKLALALRNDPGRFGDSFRNLVNVLYPDLATVSTK
jgi:8-oxo-dGTP pyrophosphatase MutT (NUDIX family)